MARTSTLLAFIFAWSLVPPWAAAQRRGAVVPRPRPIDVQITVADAVRVRTMVTPVPFDDKGHAYKPAREELAKLKGDTPEERKLAGYKWDYDNLKRGDVVQVVLSAPAGALKPKATKGDKDDKNKPKNQHWVPRRQLTGVIRTVSAREPKTLTLQVAVAPQQLRVMPDLVEGNVTIAPEQEQATAIVLLKESELPPPAKQPGKPKKN